MNRRDFIKSLSAIGIATLLPSLAFQRPHDDTPFLQSIVDRGEWIPSGAYHLRTTLDVRGKALNSIGNDFTIHAPIGIYGDKHTTGLFTRNHLRFGDGHPQLALFSR